MKEPEATRIALVSLAICLACQPSPAAKSTAESSANPKLAGLTTAEEAAVRARDVAWQKEANAGAATAVGALFSTHATLLPPEASARHGPSVASSWGDMIARDTAHDAPDPSTNHATRVRSCDVCSDDPYLYT